MASPEEVTNVYREKLIQIAMCEDMLGDENGVADLIRTPTKGDIKDVPEEVMKGIVGPCYGTFDPAYNECTERCKIAERCKEVTVRLELSQKRFRPDVNKADERSRVMGTKKRSIQRAVSENSSVYPANDGMEKIDQFPVKTQCLPPEGTTVEFRDNGELLAQFKVKTLDGHQAHGILWYHTDIIKNERLITNYHPEKNPFQRLQKPNADVFRNLRQKFRDYYESGDTADIPSGTLLLAIPEGSDFETAEYIKTLDGGQRNAAALSVAKEKKKGFWIHHSNVTMVAGLSDPDLATEFGKNNRYMPLGADDKVSHMYVEGKVQEARDKVKQCAEEIPGFSWKIVDAIAEYKKNPNNTVFFGHIVRPALFAATRNEPTAKLVEEQANEIPYEIYMAWMRVYKVFRQKIGLGFETIKPYDKMSNQHALNAWATVALHFPIIDGERDVRRDAGKGSQKLRSWKLSEEDWSTFFHCAKECKKAISNLHEKMLNTHNMPDRENLIRECLDGFPIENVTGNNTKYVYLPQDGSRPLKP